MWITTVGTKPAPVLIQLAQPSPIKPSSELLHQGGLLSPAAGEMLNSCTCPSPSVPAFTEADTAAALTSRVTYIPTNAARLTSLRSCKHHASASWTCCSSSGCWGGRKNSSAKEAHTVQAKILPCLEGKDGTREKPVLAGGPNHAGQGRKSSCFTSWTLLVQIVVYLTTSESFKLFLQFHAALPLREQTFSAARVSLRTDLPEIR